MDDATTILTTWQAERLRTVHVPGRDYGMCNGSVTALAYSWGADETTGDPRFFRIESAFRETWLQCGMMKSVIVTDRPTPEMIRFAEQFPAVEIQVEPSLVAGDILSMSRDCNGKLAERFDTDHVLIVQNDGFPLRPGLEPFLGKWDFVGAPYVRDKFLPRLIARALHLWICNGGFSLRSHRMCEMAAYYWKRKWHARDGYFVIGEDAYYTATLFKHEWKYNRAMKTADTRAALKFAWDSLVPQDVSELPFGFHRASTFANFVQRGWIR